MLRILICGINGRMGNAIYESSIKSGHSVLCGVDIVTVGKTECPVYKSIDEVKDLIDVIIDFSSPSAIYEILDYSKRNSTYCSKRNSTNYSKRNPTNSSKRNSTNYPKRNPTYC